MRRTERYLGLREWLRQRYIQRRVFFLKKVLNSRRSNGKLLNILFNKVLKETDKFFDKLFLRQIKKDLLIDRQKEYLFVKRQKKKDDLFVKRQKEKDDLFCDIKQTFEGLLHEITNEKILPLVQNGYAKFFARFVEKQKLVDSLFDSPEEPKTFDDSEKPKIFDEYKQEKNVEKVRIFNQLHVKSQEKMFRTLNVTDKKKLFDQLSSEVKGKLLSKLSRKDKEKLLSGKHVTQLTPAEKQNAFEQLTPAEKDKVFSRMNYNEKTEALAHLSDEDKQNAFDQLTPKGKKRVYLQIRMKRIQEEKKALKKYQKKLKRISRKICYMHVVGTYTNMFFVLRDHRKKLISTHSSGTVGFKKAQRRKSYQTRNIMAKFCRITRQKKYHFVHLIYQGVFARQSHVVRLVRNFKFDLLSFETIDTTAHNGCRAPNKAR